MPTEYANGKKTSVWEDSTEAGHSQPISRTTDSDISSNITGTLLTITLKPDNIPGKQHYSRGRLVKVDSPRVSDSKTTTVDIAQPTVWWRYCIFSGGV